MALIAAEKFSTFYNSALDYYVQLIISKPTYRYYFYKIVFNKLIRLKNVDCSCIDFYAFYFIWISNEKVFYWEEKKHISE